MRRRNFTSDGDCTIQNASCTKFVCDHREVRRDSHPNWPCTCPMQINTRAWRCWGLGCFIQLLDVYIGIPSLEHRAQCSVEGLDARLQQQMRTALAPLHLLLLAESFAHDLVHRRFHKPRGYGLTVPIPLAVIRDEVTIIHDIRAKCPTALITM